MNEQKLPRDLITKIQGLEEWPQPNDFTRAAKAENYSYHIIKRKDDIRIAITVGEITYKYEFNTNNPETLKNSTTGPDVDEITYSDDKCKIVLKKDQDSKPYSGREKEIVLALCSEKPLLRYALDKGYLYRYRGNNFQFGFQKDDQDYLCLALLPQMPDATKLEEDSKSYPVACVRIDKRNNMKFHPDTNLRSYNFDAIEKFWQKNHGISLKYFLDKIKELGIAIYWPNTLQSIVFEALEQGITPEDVDAAIQDPSQTHKASLDSVDLQ